jgi:alkanesulfonate monooxygenase SsuD/methylene tetrahydromethanopterin reductase-like flavin-dependent oxidoreductase (luciferase family)
MSNENRLRPLFGANVDPAAADPDEPFRRAQVAEENGLDLITIQDHPYNFKFLETWTLLAMLAARTQRLHFGANVLSTPLRPPAMLAKQAATLDLLSDGRLELGLGAGAFLQGIRAYGGPEGSPGVRYQAFQEYLEIVQGMWANAGGSFSFQGKFHQIRGARPGPAPAHPIRIWIGATGPRMLRLTGRLAGGLLVSTTYVLPERLVELNRLIDAGAAGAGRSPQEIRRGYNLMGVLDLGRPDTQLAEAKPGRIYGPVEHWAAEIARFYHEYRQDTFIFWPIGGNELLQIEAFARQVVPAALARL